MGNKPADEKLFARTSCTKWITPKNRSFLFWEICLKPKNLVGTDLNVVELINLTWSRINLFIIFGEHFITILYNN